MSVESETPTYGIEAGAKELFVDPAEVEHFLSSLSHRPIPNLKGVVWFRLPTADDCRTWNVDTWRDVIELRPLTTNITATISESTDDGARDIFITNRGTTDTRLPKVVRLSVNTPCSFADSLPPYSIERDLGGFLFSLQRDIILERGRSRNIGWVRCPVKGVQINDPV